MNVMENTLTHRDRQIVCGLFLSKYGREGLKFLGFENFAEAYNALGYGLGAKPMSIKNYRDEFDPYFPNERKGWHGRPLRDFCKAIMDAFAAATLTDLGSLIKRFVAPETGLQQMAEVQRVIKAHEPDAESAFAKRLITGKAAEEYFLAHWPGMTEFAGMSLSDTTSWGCGFDFKMTHPVNNSYSAVEVKGLRAKTGQIQFTELEYAMAEALVNRFYLVLVRNFVEKPFHSIIRNPLHSDLNFKRKERKEVFVSWSASVN